MSPSSASSSALYSVLSGSIAGSVSTFAGAPFDYVKVRLQTHPNSTVVDLLAQTVRERRLRNFFSGTTPALIVAVLENSVVFGANSLLKHGWRSMSGKNEETLLETALLGGLSGVFSAAAISPAETVKVRLQTNKACYGNPTACLKRIVHEEGAVALFRGLPAQIPRDSLFNFFFFSAFEACCRLTASAKNIEKNQLGAFDLVVAGGLAGATGWTFTLPFDVVKSRSQGMKFPENTSSLTVAKEITKEIFRESGPKGFFRGWGAAVARAFPVNGVLFACYSLTERALQSE
jgi:hypothetical protein